MELKILETIATMSIENILKEMRKFSPDPLNCLIMINTRSNPEETDPEKQHDAYSVEFQVDGTDSSFLTKAFDVYWHFDPREGEGIRKREPIPPEEE